MKALSGRQDPNQPGFLRIQAVEEEPAPGPVAVGV